MADRKIISATAKAQVASVDDGAKTATAAIKEITADVKNISVTSAVPSHCVESRLKGFGEEWIPDTRKFAYLPDALDLVDVVVFTLAAGRAVSDSVSKTETLEFEVTFGRLLLDVLSKTEHVAKVFSKGTRDTSTTTEALAKALGLVLAGNLYPADSLTKSLSKAFEDSTQPLSDVLFKDIGRTIEDSVDATDDFLGVSNVDDDQTAAFIKVLVDTRSVLETHAKLVSSTKIETANTVENITASLQNYFASDYAPYGYAGSTYTL